MSELKDVGKRVANVAEILIPELIGDGELPSITTPSEAQAIIDRIVTQAPASESKRIWAVVLAVLTAVLAVPEVQTMLGPWAPVVTAALSALLAGWSKASDPRPTR